MSPALPLRCGVLLWHDDGPPPSHAFDRVWVAARDGCPARFVAYRDVDDISAAGAPGLGGAGAAWAQIFPDHPVALPRTGNPGALMVIRTRPSDAISDEEFNAWYDTDHLPPLAASESCLRVRRFWRADAEYPYLALYDITNWEAWDVNPARARVRSSAWAKRVVPRFARTEGYYSPLPTAPAAAAAATTTGGTQRGLPA